MKKIRWGILSTAKIAREQLIPAIQKSQFGEVVAIASRSEQRAEQCAFKLGIEKSYGSYEDLLEDPDIDAVYNPLPNDMHVPWTIRAIDAGKHVLCEKPIALNSRQAEQLMNHDKAKSEIKVMEAFMYRFHPQWQMVKSLAEEGRIGDIHQINSVFTYFKDDPDNIRSNPEQGGGGLMDIGCYCISVARWIYGKEPKRVSGILHKHSQWDVDILGNAILDFGEGMYSSFTCGTQTIGDQYVELFGNKGKIRVNRPFNAPTEEPCTIEVHLHNGYEIIEVVPANQYTIQVDAMARAILDNTDVPYTLSDA
ncbi:MAG: Gfo/Idh/MocA family oxidoreductase, partial [Cyclobacteriaceae bacterium]